jgi:hypothetical protein
MSGVEIRSNSTWGLFFMFLPPLIKCIVVLPLETSAIQVPRPRGETGAVKTYLILKSFGRCTLSVPASSPPGLTHTYLTWPSLW